MGHQVQPAQKQQLTPARAAALGGLLSALGTAVMALGTLIPAASYCCPMLASLALLPARQNGGGRLAAAVYAVTAALSLLLSPDREAAMLYLLLGWYPAVKPRLDRLPRPARPAVKLALFAAALLAGYGLLAGLLGIPAEEPPALQAALFAAGLGTLLLYDWMLTRMTKIRPRRQ